MSAMKNLYHRIQEYQEHTTKRKADKAQKVIQQYLNGEISLEDMSPTHRKLVYDNPNQMQWDWSQS